MGKALYAQELTAPSPWCQAWAAHVFRAASDMKLCSDCERLETLSVLQGGGWEPGRKEGSRAHTEHALVPPPHTQTELNQPHHPP